MRHLKKWWVGMDFIAPINYVTIHYCGFMGEDGWWRKDLSVCPSPPPCSEPFSIKSGLLTPLQPLPSCFSDQIFPIYSENIYWAAATSPSPRPLLQGMRVEDAGGGKGLFWAACSHGLVHCCLIELSEMMEMFSKIRAVQYGQTEVPWTTCYRRCGWDPCASA